MGSRVGVGQTEIIYNETFVDRDGAFATGLSPSVQISRDDGQFWNGSGYQASPPALSMTEVDATNLPGVYAYSFVATSGQVSEEQHLVVIDANDATVTNDYQIGTFHVGWTPVWDVLIAATQAAGSMGRTMLRILAHAAGRYRTVRGDPWTQEVYVPDDVPTIGGNLEDTYNLKQSDGSDIQDTGSENPSDNSAVAIFERDEP